MKLHSSFGFFVLLIALVIVGGAGLAMRWRDALLLRAEFDAVRFEAGELERLRVENKKLRDRQISAAELEALRADHAALPRLRAGIEALKKRSPSAGP